MSVEVCIPSKLRVEKLTDTVESLFSRAERWDTSIAIGIDTDDPETMNTVLDLRKRWPSHKMRVDINRPGDGHVAAMNTLLRGSSADIVVVFADDCRIHSDGWDAHIQKHFYESSLTCLGLSCPGDYLETLRPTYGNGVNDNMGHYHFTVAENKWLFSFPAVFAFRRSAFSLTGYFDERFRRWFGDVDFSTTMFMKNCHVEICKQVHCFSYDAHTSDVTTQLAEKTMTVEDSHNIYCDKWFFSDRTEELKKRLLNGDTNYWSKEASHKD